MPPSGSDARQMPWKPSQPAMKSQSIDSASPSFDTKRTRGRSVSIASIATSRASKWIGSPVARRAAMRSFTTSCWP
jgi:hypothetical protein